jgi:hypothetical protein
MTSLSKKRGRPVGSKNKPAVKSKPAADVKTFKQSDVDKLQKEILENDVVFNHMIQEIESLELKIKSLEHTVNQYKVVIDYLEAKLEIK